MTGARTPQDGVRGGDIPLPLLMVPWADLYDEHDRLPAGKDISPFTTSHKWAGTHTLSTPHQASRMHQQHPGTKRFFPLRD
jgi:hypothetical protein